MFDCTSARLHTTERRLGEVGGSTLSINAGNGKAKKNNWLSVYNTSVCRILHVAKNAKMCRVKQQLRYLFVTCPYLITNRVTKNGGLKDSILRAKIRVFLRVSAKSWNNSDFVIVLQRIAGFWIHFQSRRQSGWKKCCRNWNCPPYPKHRAILSSPLFGQSMLVWSLEKQYQGEILFWGAICIWRLKAWNQ